MLKAFRQQGITSAIYGLIIVATVVVFIVQFRPGAQGRSGSIRQECAAEIRGRCIEPKEYQAELMLVAPGRMIEASQLKALGLRKFVLDGLLERTLLVQDAERLGLAVSEEDLDNELVAGRAHVSLPVEHARMLAYSLRLTDDLVRLLPVTNPDTKLFDYKTYDRVVRQFSNRSPTEFKVMQREELLAARMRDLVRSRVRVGDDEAFTSYQRRNSTATIDFVTFRRSWFAHHVLDLSPPAVEGWARNHKEEIDRVFETRKSQYAPECRTARHILVKVPEGATDEQKAEASKKAGDIRERVKKGEDFAKVARKESEDSSAADGGDLGCFQRGRMVKPFEDAVYAMSPGEISPLVESQFGFHVIKLEGIHKDADAEAIGRQETAKNLMITQETEAMAAEVGKKVLAAVKAGKKFEAALSDALPKSAAASKAKTDKAGKGPKGENPKDGASKDESASGTDESDRPRLETSAPFNASGEPIEGAAAGQNVAQIAFRLERTGDVPDDLVKLEDGYAVIQLKEKKTATKEQFEKERETFLATMLAAKQSDALNGYVMRLKEAAKSETKLNQAYSKAAEKEKPSEGEEE
ncbi:MAG TPA: peptidylprolyl isomerase [Polyangiaceae bacterium]